MRDMRNTIRVFLGLVAVAVLATGCVKTLNLHDTTMDSEYEADKVSTFYLWKALQIDDVNVNGIDIKPYFDWFDSFQLEIRRTDGKISGIKMNNGNIPHDMYGFNLPTEEVECYFDNSVQPNAIRRKSDNQIVAVFRKGVVCMEFKMDCKTVSYRFMFSGKNN